MKVGYINCDLDDLYARCTFLGYDAKGRRRPRIDLDASDLVRMVEIAKEFRQRQRTAAVRHSDRANRITAAGVTEE